MTEHAVSIEEQRRALDEHTKALLAPLACHYRRSDVDAIAINGPEVVHHKRAEPKAGERRWRQVRDPNMTRAYLDEVLEALKDKNTLYDEVPEHSVIFSQTPTDDRVFALCGRGIGDRPHLERGGGIAIHIRRNLLHSLCRPNEKVAGNIHMLAERTQTPNARQTETPRVGRPLGLPAAEEAALIEAVRYGPGIIVAGETDTGKTTFTNTLLGWVGDDTRVITLETCARELRVTAPNRVHIMAIRDSDTRRTGLSEHDAWCYAGRLRPDLMVMGEESGLCADLMGRASRSEDGVRIWTNVFARSAHDAIEALAELAHKANPKRSTAEQGKGLAENNVVVVMGQDEDKRYVKSIRFPPRTWSPPK